MNWIAKIILTILGILVCVMFILLGAHFFNDLFQIWPVHIDSIKPCDKFEVYRDLLIIVLAAFGVVGYFVYREIRTRLEGHLEKTGEMHENSILSGLYYRLSYIHFREYEMIDPYYIDRDPRFKELLDLAIEEIVDSIKYRVKIKIPDKEQEGKLSISRLNLAYHLAVRKKPEDKDKALELVKENRIKAIEAMPSDEYDLRENAIWVILNYSDNEEEKLKARNEMQELLQWDKIPDDWKKQMIEKYSKNFKISFKFQTTP